VFRRAPSACPHPRQATAPGYSPPAKSQNRPDLSLWRLCEARGFLFSVFDMARFVLRGRLHISPYAACCYAIFFKLLIPAITGRFISSDEGHGSRQRPGYQVTPNLSLSCPMHAKNKTDSVQKTSPPVVKQAAYGETRAAIIKKKLMKNKLSVEAAAPANADQLSSNRTDKRVKINTARRQANRALNTDKLLSLLRTEAPNFYAIAEIVGKWVWIQFDQKQPVTVTALLSELGFHWNGKRQSWQHPCGIFRDRSVNFDPRKKYGSRFAADVNPA
jgi:hypothetical protein